MATPARDFSIVYGSFTVGAASRGIDGNIVVEKDFPSFAVEFKMLAKSTTESGFNTEIQAIEDAFTKPWQDLRITFAGQAMWNFRQSLGEAFEVQPRIVKREDDPSSRLARRYTIRIEGQLPAEASGHSGRRTSTVSISRTASRRRRVEISGEWTGTTSEVGARTNYAAQIDAYVISVLDSINDSSSGDVNYELVDEPVQEFIDSSTGSGHLGGVLRFSRVYEELLYAQAGSLKTAGTQGAKGDAQITRQVFRVRRSRVGPGDAGNARRLQRAFVTYEADIDAGANQNLRAKWDVIREWILGIVRTTVFQSGVIAVVDESPEFDFTDNRITASMEVHGTGGSNVLQRQVTVEDKDTRGLNFAPVWNGNARAAFVYQGPEERVRTITDVATVVGSPKGNPFAGQFWKDEPGAAVTERRATSTNRFIGNLDISGSRIEVHEFTRIVTLRIFDPVEGGRFAGGTIAQGDPTGTEDLEAGFRKAEDSQSDGIGIIGPLGEIR